MQVYMHLKLESTNGIDFRTVLDNAGRDMGSTQPTNLEICPPKPLNSHVPSEGKGQGVLHTPNLCFWCC